MNAQGTRVGVVGLGNLGLPVARRLAAAGAKVLAFDVSTHSREAAAGIELTASVRELAERTDIVLIVVSDAAQSATVISGEDGITSAAKAPRVVVMMATIGPEATAELAEPLTAAGSALIDAPVSGGAQAALAGELSLMVGGGQEHIAVCSEVLEALGTVHLLGGLGAGQSAKLANQIVFFGAQAALQEAMALADSYGVDREALLKALSGGTADCWAVRHWGFFDETAQAYDDAGVEPSHRPWHKDLRKAAQVASGRGLDGPVTDLIAQVFGDRVDRDARKQ